MRSSGSLSGFSVASTGSALSSITSPPYTARNSIAAPSSSTLAQSLASPRRVSLSSSSWQRPPSPSSAAPLSPTHPSSASQSATAAPLALGQSASLANTQSLIIGSVGARGIAGVGIGAGVGVGQTAAHVPTVAFSVGKRETFTPTNGFKTVAKKLRQRGFRVVVFKSPLTPSLLKLPTPPSPTSPTSPSASASVSVSQSFPLPATTPGRDDDHFPSGSRHGLALPGTRAGQDDGGVKETPEVIVFGAPREKFSQGEFTTLKQYLDSATPTTPRAIIYLALEGGESGLPSTSVHPWSATSPSSGGATPGPAGQAPHQDTATNFNYLLEELGVVVQPDSVAGGAYPRRPVGGAAVVLGGGAGSAGGGPGSPPRSAAAAVDPSHPSGPTLPPLPTHHAYHPKEVLVHQGVLNRALTRAAMVVRGLSDRAGAAGAVPPKGTAAARVQAHTSHLAFVYPFGATLAVQRPAVPLLSTGVAGIPLSRPVLAAWEGGTGGGAPSPPRATSPGVAPPPQDRGAPRVVVCGSAAMFSDGYVEREGNAVVWEVLVGWCVGTGVAPGGAALGGEGGAGEAVVWNAIDASEPELSDPHPAPALPSLASTPRPCLDSGTEDLPRDFARLFDGGVFGFDPPRRVGGSGSRDGRPTPGDSGLGKNGQVGGMVGGAVRKKGPILWRDLYASLRLPPTPLTLIHPTFETPLPPLQPAVFQPALREPPPPPLELFDLDDMFMEAGRRLGEVGGKCTDADLDYYILACGDILGVSDKVGVVRASAGKPGVRGSVEAAKRDPEKDARRVLEHVLKSLVGWKKTEVGVVGGEREGAFGMVA
ncbi:hypothetical protein M427DRAFT_27306 [Gonapodya prolifera JEL478]|uniref:Uncharacterized protein n=1 Tax=Gonapodya prolifera (strain JEL478) TaxID=1344416 RepID=A0A139AYE4_GONPJ|nr:hypothetical protein M427DRAFT_27306 [Gonapodya prolifera JEL478]|eukprot:KXS21717.1 hypothetical protein M427DRAFT_27306 [Gonapodya prolifera JEL478]